MTSHETRKSFLDFFKSKKHTIVYSSSVVPQDDPTLLFTNAGMNQFKDVFLGIGKRNYTRCADTQKCIRVSGKHNDLEEVGRDSYHHTFFEMLGNWSFGDYYKKEAIIWAWELLTEVWKLPKNRLWVTVYKTDNEAFEIWKNFTDIEPNHILPFGEKENFWEMGDSGPCGPCSEIHIDLRNDISTTAPVNEGTSECIEIWNLVFIQYNRTSDGNLIPLSQKHVDTGMGFERICRVLQNKNSNYDTDIFLPIVQKISEITSIKYTFEDNLQTDVAMRVIADHIRTLTFAISDGAIPSNEGRGYVLRRILRRASRFGRILNMHQAFIYRIVDAVVETMGNIFPEIKEKQTYVERIIKNEEESFNATLDRGLEIFENVIRELKQSKIFPGEEAFKLYDTYGFPLDLTELMCEERGLRVNIGSFAQLMKEQKKRSQKSSTFKSEIQVSTKHIDNIDLSNHTEFIYDSFDINTKIIFSSENKILLEKTPFYAESGGQISDTGFIELNGSNIEVIDVVKKENLFYHISNQKIENAVGKYIFARIDIPRRFSIMRNHTATHLFHSALRKIVGTHAHQSGSLVSYDKLRFDFNHFDKLKKEEIEEIEILVNEKIRENISLTHHKNIPLEEAKKMGALMFFGEKYGEKVNVVQFGNFSIEFCGGTHTKSTGEIGFFKIINEASISSGVRRIEAITGTIADDFIREKLKVLEFSKNILNVSEEQIQEKILELLEEKKKLGKELSKFRLLNAQSEIEKIILNSNFIGNIKIVTTKYVTSDIEELKNVGDILRTKLKTGIGFLVSEFDGKTTLLCVVTDDLIKEKKINAGKLVSEIAKQLNGGGGGKPHLATAGIKNVENIDIVFEKIQTHIKQILPQ